MVHIPRDFDRGSHSEFEDLVWIDRRGAFTRGFAMRTLLAVSLCATFGAGRIEAQTRPYWQHTSDQVALACRASTGHIDWQWGANPANKAESPVGAIKAAGGGSSSRSVLESLQFGQRHNQTAMDVYAACARAHDTDYLAYLVATTSSLTCAPTLLAGHLAFLYRNNPAAVINVNTDYGGFAQLTDPIEQDRFLLKLFGQIVDAYATIPKLIERAGRPQYSMMRACFRESPVSFFAAVTAAIT